MVFGSRPVSAARVERLPVHFLGPRLEDRGDLLRDRLLKRVIASLVGGKFWNPSNRRLTKPDGKPTHFVKMKFDTSNLALKMLVFLKVAPAEREKSFHRKIDFRSLSYSIVPNWYSSCLRRPLKVSPLRSRDVMNSGLDEYPFSVIPYGGILSAAS